MDARKIGRILPTTKLNKMEGDTKEDSRRGRNDALKTREPSGEALGPRKELFGGITLP